MKTHESPPPPNKKKSIRGDSGDSWPVWNRGIRQVLLYHNIRTNYVVTTAESQPESGQQQQPPRGGGKQG